MRPYIKEACVEGLEQSLIAQSRGANRLELCQRLDLDGLSPSPEAIAECRRILTIPLRVMVRPHDKGYRYTSAELNEMKEIIDFCKILKVDAVVFGFLNDDHTIDIERTREFVEYAHPLKTIFHRAIEKTPDISKSLEMLVTETQIDGILTSGISGKALNEIPFLKEMVGKMKGKELIVCGKVTDENIEHLHQEIGANAYHGRSIVGSLSN